MWRSVVLGLLAASAVDLASAQNVSPAAPICLRVHLRSESASWIGLFAFDTAGLGRGDYRFVVGADTTEDIPHGHWRVRSDDSLYIRIGFVDSGFEIVLRSLFGDSVSGRAHEWGVATPAQWAATAVKTKNCHAPSYRAGLPAPRQMRLRPPA